MLKILKKYQIAIISLMLVLICGITYCVTNYIQSKQIATTTQAITRTIEVKNNEVDYQSIFDEFEDVKIDINENITSFEGTKTFNLVDFEELDLVSDSNVDTRLKVKYSYAFDSEQNIVSLSATLLNEGGTEIVDTMIGVPFVDENGNFDAVFDCDGELLLLSELREAGMIENCGWLKNLCKKVANVAKKVVKNVATFVYENADVIVPLAIGIIGGLTGGAVIPILIAGSVAGAAIDGTKTAVQTYQETGKVDWAATGISAGIGAAVGAIATYTGYSIGSMLKSETNNTSNGSTQSNNNNNSSAKNSWGNTDTLTDHFDRHGADFKCANEIDYAQKANNFYKNKINYQVKVDSSGVTRVYDKSTNIFGSYNPDGTTKTFFKPSEGQSYFDNQPGV